MKKCTYCIFLTYLILGIYVLGITIKTPFVSLTLDTTNGQPVFVDSYYPLWAEQKNIEKGDIIVAIDRLTSHGESLRSTANDR